MTSMSDEGFRTLHALRIKGFASTATVAELASVPIDVAEHRLRDLAARELAMFREARSLWQLTPAGREHHAEQLAADREAADVGALRESYGAFLGLNERFKVLCGEWQLRDGEPNDHADAGYDAGVVAKLVALDGDARPIVDELGRAVPRLEPYSARLADSCAKVVGGDQRMFTGVMCGSYHDVWMELHEDLILTQGIDRAKEGSF